MWGRHDNTPWPAMMPPRPPGSLPDEAQPPYSGPFWAKITGQAASTNRYAFEAIDESDTTAFNVGLSAGFAQTGTSAVGGSPAYEVNGVTNVPNGTRVKLWPAGDLTYYTFEYAPASSSSVAAAAQSTGVTGVVFSSDGTFYTDPGGVSLPAAGTYLVYMLVSTYAQITSSAPGYIEYRLWDDTNSVAASVVYIHTVPLNTVAFNDTLVLIGVVVTTGAAIIRAQGRRVAGPTWSLAAFTIGIFNPATYGYVRIL